MADTASFTIVYDGPALESNEIAIRELAPALISVADLLEEANRIINGGGTAVNVNVRGSFKNGSFGIDFTVIQNLIGGIVSFFASDGITAAVNLITLLGLVSEGRIGLIGFLKRLKNRPIEKIEEIDDRQVRIQITNTETIEMDKRVLDLYKDLGVRRALEGAIAKPLEKEGIDSVLTGSIERDRRASGIRVDKEEKPYFDVPELEDETLEENITEAYLHVISLSFKEDNKWRFQRGDMIFYALITDTEFLEKVDRNEIQFSKDDILKVELQTRDFLAGDGLRTEYTVIKVLEHRSAARQLRLQLKEDTDE